MNHHVKYAKYLLKQLCQNDSTGITSKYIYMLSKWISKNMLEYLHSWCLLVYRNCFYGIPFWNYFSPPPPFFFIPICNQHQWNLCPVTSHTAVIPNCGWLRQTPFCKDQCWMEWYSGFCIWQRRAVLMLNLFQGAVCKHVLCWFMSIQLIRSLSESLNRITASYSLQH